MKIVFFGSSHGYPEQGKKCSCALLEVGESRYLLDIGSDAVSELVDREIPLEAVKGIFVTHMHGDHTNGLIPFLDVCSWKFKKADPFVYLPGDVEGTRAALAAWLRCNGTPLRPFAFHQVKEGPVYEDADVCVRAIKTRHTSDSYAYLIEGEGKRVLFTGDLRDPQKDFPTAALAAPLDLAVCECAHFEADKYLSVFAEGVQVERLCFNHYSKRLLDTVYATMPRLPIPSVFLAKDGMEILL